MIFAAKLGLGAALVFSLAQGGCAQSSTEIEQHIQHVTSGLSGEIILKGEKQPTHTLAERMKELNVPGVSIAVVHNGKIEWARGFGFRSIGGAPVNTETMFQAGSISKPLAAMACLRLIEQGKLSLDTDVNTYLRSWKLPADPVTGGKPVTLRELLTHTGGITVHGFPGYASNEPVPTLVQVLNGEKPANTAPIRSEAAPGTRWNYSGGGYTILQQAVLDVTRQPFPKLLHDTVLGPIGMTRSTYDQPLTASFRDNAATPYRGDGKPVAGGAHTYPEMAAAGLWTTPTDIAKYSLEVVRSLDGKANHVLSPDMTRQMLTRGMGNWGLGLELGGSDSNPYFAHGGVNEGFVNTFVMYEKSGEGAVVMTNGDGGGQVGDEVVHSIAVEYNWPDFRPLTRAAIQVDPKILETYAGSYAINKDVDIAITLENGQLMWQATSSPKFPLYAESENRFFLLIAPPDSSIVFEKDAQGKTTAMLLHQGAGGDRTILKK